MDKDRIPFLTHPMFPWLVVGVFLCRILPWALADLWFDEVVTLTNFGLGPEATNSLLDVFRIYPAANNHILFSAILWAWLHLADYSHLLWTLLRWTDNSYLEGILRLPSIALGVLTLWCVMSRWRRWLGRAQANAAALLFALSPVYAPFAYQLRGYSLSVLLAALAVDGTIGALQKKPHWSDEVVCVASGLLLPLTIPTNALVVGGLILYLASRTVDHGEGLGARLRRILPLAVGAGLGCGYYLTILPQFIQAVRQTDGWDSSTLVAANCALGFAAHAGALTTTALLWWPGPAATLRAVAKDIRPAVVMLGLNLLPAALLLAVAKRAPFPRTLLPLFPIATFTVFRALRQAPVWKAERQVILVLAVILGAVAWEGGASALTARQMRRGKRPQNLLQQYYRGSTGLSQVAARLAREGLAAESLIVVPDHDYPAFLYYWSTLFKQPARQVISEGRARPQSVDPNGTGPARQPMAVATAPAEAQRLLQRIGLPGPPTQIFACRGRALYRQAAQPGPGSSPPG